MASSDFTFVLERDCLAFASLIVGLTSGPLAPCGSMLLEKVAGTLLEKAKRQLPA
jgi:hypothetical protein